MPALRTKLPPAESIVEDIRSGASLDEIARRYAVTTNYLRDKIRHFGPIASFAHRRHPQDDDRRIVVLRRVTAAEFGGTAYLPISLPRNSMWEAAREAARGH